MTQDPNPQDLNPQDSSPQDPNQALKAQLAENLDEAEWDWLIPHLQRDTIVIVDPNLDLLEAGVAIASDNMLLVKRWMEEQLIHKPQLEEVADWERDRKKRFKALIVQPFILIQAVEK
ncbi:MAG: DUF2288 domain-containing protein [Microcoleaceae cyanobacterium]